MTDEKAREIVVSEPDLIASPPPKTPMVVTPVITEKKVSLAVNMARQNAGYYTEPEWPDVLNLPKQITYILRRGGLFEVRKNTVGTFVILRDKFANPLPGFPKDDPGEGFMMNFGKIPFELFQETLSFFKDICDESKDEVYVQTFWDPAESKYFNYVPKQTVSGASVRYDRDIELEKRCVLVLETHSHNTMGAFWSGTDNNDEKADRFFGVIGELNRAQPAMLYSYVCGGKRVNIDPTSIFQHVPTRDFSDWKSRVTRGGSTYTYSVGPGHGQYQPQYGQSGHSSPYSWGDDDYSDSPSGSKPQGYDRAAAYTPDKPNHRSGSHQPALWGSERDRKSQSEREKEAAEIVEKAAKEAREEIDGDGLPTMVKPYFAAPVSEALDEKTKKLIVDITALFKMRGDTMTDVEKQTAFGALLNALSDDNVGELAQAMVDFGHTAEMLRALTIDIVVDDDEAQVEEIAG